MVVFSESKRRFPKTERDGCGMIGGAVVVEMLRRERVDHVFGLIGSSTMEVFDALHGADDVTYVGVRHEANAVHMADGYARVSRRPGVALAGQNGPGATNLTTGLAQAYHAFSPVIALAGYPASSHVGKDSFQEIDQQALFSPITKKTFTVNVAARLSEFVERAFFVAQSGRRGPVVVNVPRDLLAADVELPPQRGIASAHRMAPAREELERAAQLLGSAQRPLVIAGAGVKWSGASLALTQLAERLGAPIAASAGHPDVVSNDHPLFAGQVGPRGNRVATELAREADVILALGTRLAFNTTFYSHDNLSSDAAIIQVDVEPTALGHYFPIEVGLVADAAELVAALLDRVDGRPDATQWVDGFRSSRAELLAERAERAGEPTDSIQPARVFAEVQRALPRQAVVALDAGTCCLQATDVIQTFEPPAVMTPLDFGLVGFAYAAGLGAKAAAPDRPVLSLMGDGGFGMTIGEIGTAIAAGLHTVTVVMNNGCWGAEKAYQRDFYGGRFLGADTVNPDFALVARSFGAHGVRVEDPADIATAVHEAFNLEMPSIIEVPVDPDAIVSFRRDSFAHRTATADATA